MKSHKLFISRGLAGIAVFLAMGACASLGRQAPPNPGESGLDPSSLVDPGALMVIRADKAIIDSLLPLFLSKDQVKALEGLGGGLKLAALAILPRKEASPPGGLPPFEAALMGRFPTFKAKLALSLSRGWKHRAGIWTNAELGLGLAFPRKDLVLVASGSPKGLVARLAEIRQGPFPADLKDLSSRALACWIPDPFGRLGEALLGERLDIPAEGILIAADLKESSYTATLAFQMRDSEAARVYRPAARLAWFALSRYLLPGRPGLGSVRFEIRDRALIAQDLVLDAADLSEVLARLGLASN